MAAATITIEDEPMANGQVAVALKLTFSGGFLSCSPAHQGAQALLKLWDEQMGLNKIGTPIVDPTIKVPEPMLAVPEGAEATPVA